VTGSNNPVTLTMDGPKSVTATFQGGGGCVPADCEQQCTVHGGGWGHETEPSGGALQRGERGVGRMAACEPVLDGGHAGVPLLWQWTKIVHCIKDHFS
jgi:hypothetical protein